jgi:DnaJ-class molecular chaperone
MAQSNPCPQCYGTGVEYVETTKEALETYDHCHYCNGSGIVWSRNDKRNGRLSDEEDVDA